MQRSALLVLLVVAMMAMTSMAFGQVPTREFAPVQAGFSPTGDQVELYAPDRVMVKFTPGAMEKAAFALPTEKGAAVPGNRTGLDSLDAIIAEAGVTLIECFFGEMPDKAAADGIGLERWYRFDVPAGTDIPGLAGRLAADPSLEEALPDYRVFPAAVPNDPYYPNNWGHNNTAQLPSYAWGTTWAHTGPPVGTVGFDSNAQTAWDGYQGYGNSGVVIAIIDTGVDTAHSDLSLVAGYDYGDNDSNPMDDSAAAGHGTACAGVAAGIADNANVVAGMAGACSIMPLKVANSAGSMYLSSAANAINFAANNGADVASMSFGAAISSYALMDNAIQYAWNSGVVLLAATGNENASVISYPAINTYVIGVGAASPCGERKRSSSNSSEVNPGVSTDPNGYTCDGERWWGSNYGSTVQDHAGAVDLIAPTILPTTDITGSAGYQTSNYEPFFNGTSCSTPYAAGLAGLIKAANPGWTPTQIRDQLKNTALDITSVESGAGWDRYTGYGMVDAAAALAGAAVAPTAAFTSNGTTGCAPTAVLFTDQSTGTVTSWAWTFGDGGTSTAQNPNHTYAAPGTYTVSLTVSGPAGSDTLTIPGMITIYGTPVADFSATPVSGVAPLTVSFTDLSTESPTSWYWYFGDSTNGTEQNPVHTYTAPGTYSVVLVATSNCGQGTGSKLNYITVTAPPPPVAAFTTDVTSGCAPLTVTFSDQSTGDIDTWNWDFGDGQNSPEQNPSHEYAGPGLYTVTLTVMGPGGSDTAVMTDLISVGALPFAAFSASDTTGTAPLAVDFTDMSGGSDTWAWDFGDAGTDTVQNPSHVFNAEGTYTVQLIVTNTCGADTASLDIIVDAPAAPVADFSADPLSGCAPLTVAFTDLSSGDITGWAWDFGDAGTDTVQNPSHEYAAPGIYDVSLTVTGPGGSDAKAVTGMIIVAGPPTAAFSASDTTGTAPLTVDFTDLSTGDPSTWAWDFGGDGSSTAQNPSHTFSSAGVFAVQLIAGNDCGADTTSLEITVDAPAGPVAAFSGTPVSGCAPLTVAFTDESTGAVTGWNWDFGDAATDTVQNPSHTYTAPGSFDVRLIVFGPGGIDTLTAAAYVTVDTLVAADFSADVTDGPNPLMVTFTDLSTGGPTSWSWDFGDGATDTLQNPSHTFTAEGTYTVTLTATGPCGSDTVIKTDFLIVRSPSGVGDQVTSRFGLGQNYPNPFNPTTTVVFTLARSGHARLEVYDATGRLIDVLVNEQRGAGEHRVTWQPSGLASGIYFARFMAEGQTAVRRLVLVR
ncbi:PKD domain-containing protein [bacterium]|nr:PKD domain-containing protein [bacterium]